MKTLSRFACLCAVPAWLAFSSPVLADSITNNFNNAIDYTVNGVTNTMWDGVYLGFGDIYGGNNGDGNNGFTAQANETANSGYLTLQTGDTDWAGAGDDGFFLFKVVAGDFDASVENVAPFDSTSYHFSGLMARAYTANGPHWGMPYGGSENWADIMRFQEFNIDEDIRYALNGADNDGYITVPGANSDTATSRYLRITRSGDVFSFYTKTNQTDDWTLQGSLTRNDLHAVPMQVGIADASFSATPHGTATSYYTDFELSGTNVVANPTLPANPSDLTATPNGAYVTFNWTPGAGSDGSILVLRMNNTNILTQKPINTYNYNASTNFGSGDDLGGGIYVVYAGNGNSVTVSHLGTTNRQYSCALYSYKGSGSATVYGNIPATASTPGTGVPYGIQFTLTPASVPLNGVALSSLVAFDNIGDTDVVDHASVTWSSSDTSMLTVDTDGTVNPVAVGSASVIATYANFSATNTVTVHSPAYTDNFATNHDFLVAGLPGSTWDGLYLNGANIPNASYAPPLANVSDFDANTSSNGALTITAANSAWKGAQDNGPFLFKNVPGDFEASVHITSYSKLNYEFVGLQARAFNPANNAGPSGAGNSENFVDWLRFDEYGVTTTTFNTQNGNITETDENDGESSDYWLLMVRASSTNFYFFKKANATDPWLFQPSETIVRPDLTNGVPLQVGLIQSMFTANAGSVQFDTFALDAAGISGGTPPSDTTGLTVTENSSYTAITLNWVPGTNTDGSASTSFVVMRAGTPVSAQPCFGISASANSVFGQGTDLGGGNYVVFNAVGNTVTVAGLTPGVHYYAVVYGYSGSGAAKSFNILGSSTTNTPPVNFTGITASLADGIPLGGVGLPSVIASIQGGGTLDVTHLVQITPGNTNLIAATNYVMTGLALGTATNTVTFVSGTNTYVTTLVTTVRTPGYSDNFGTSQDFIANGVTNTAWDGVYAQPGAIPGTTYSSASGASVSDADANVTSNNVLTVTSQNVGFEYAEDDGFYLFKNVTGDFQAAVHISYLNSSFTYDGGSMVGYNNPGLLARACNTNGSPYDINTLNRGETWVSFTRFDMFGIGTYARYTLNNSTVRSSQPGGFSGASSTSDTNLWLLMVRQNGTNFLFFQRQFATDPWAPTPNGTTYAVTNFAGLPLQVGLLAGGFNSGNAVTVGFDSFMLDQISTSPALKASISGGQIQIRWPASGTYTLQYTPSLTQPNWQTVPVSPVTASGTNTVTIPTTNTAAFFRLSP